MNYNKYFLREIKEIEVLFKNPLYLKVLLINIFLFVFSLFATHFAIKFTQKSTTSELNDFFWETFPLDYFATSTEYVYVYGGVILFLFILFVLIFKLKYLPFSLFALSNLFIVRSFFNSITIIGPNAERVIYNNISTFKDLISTSDYFFSGHTAVPFMFFLIFYKNKILSRVFLFISIFFGITVLIGHLHYSIDVFAAPFITYSVFILSRKLFRSCFKKYVEKHGII